MEFETGARDPRPINIVHDEAPIADKRGGALDDAQVCVAVVDDGAEGGDGAVFAGEVADLAGGWGGGIAFVGGSGVVGV